MATLVQTIDPPERGRSGWLTQAWLEPRLVVVTLAALVASIAAENAGAPAWFVLLLNLTSYAAGGIFGLQEVLIGLRLLRPAGESEHEGGIVLNVDLLMLLAAVGAALIDQWHEGAMLLFLFSLSNVLQDYAIGRSRQAIRSLMKLYPAEAKVKRPTGVQVVKLDQLRPGDIVLIEPGERIPVDGVIVAGRSAVDQAPITGESMPVEKAAGDKVFAGTLNQQGSLDVEAAGHASDTVLARIIRMVEEAQDSKAPTERFLERFEQVYALVILSAVGLFIVVPPALGWMPFADNFYRAMVLMTVASPCALVISTPAAFISAIASAARTGVLFKGGAYIEGLAAIKAVAFDKTGTLTAGRPTVTDLVPADGVTESELLIAAASAEARSEHPLAKAVVAAHKAGVWSHLPLPEPTAFEALPGRGVVAVVAGACIEVGSPLALADGLPAALDAQRVRLESEGKTVMLVKRNGQHIGALALADGLRPEAKAMIAGLKAQGITVAMLTGDNARVAARIAAQAGVDRVYAELLPQDKVTAIQQLGAEVGDTAMVGDGVNDAPALATASIGMAMGAAGTDVALETADVVLMGDRLELIPYAIALSRKARRVVWQNIAFSLAVIVMLIAGAFVINLPLPLGVLGHEGSTVIVVMNGLIQLLILPEIARRRMAA
jgi:Cd2+/Zn2+-exporting ATPase